jgi:ABC-type polysaccharide/polyol phosphate export permease
MCGLIPYTIFSETVARSSNILLENAGMITKMVFPYEFFPIAVLITSFIAGGITLVLTGILMLFWGVSPSLMGILYLPLFLVPLVLVTTGISWIISCVAVSFRDIVHVVPVVLNLLFFATPVLYSYEMMASMGEKYPALVTLAKLNPLYSIVVGLRISLIGNEFVLDAGIVFMCYFLSVSIFFFGGMIFRVFKRDLADLI